jgi:hypothetical protein
MEIAQAVESALLILDDETVRPTIKYRYLGEEWPLVTRWQAADLRDNGYSTMTAGELALTQMRKGRLRPSRKTQNFGALKAPILIFC